MLLNPWLSSRLHVLADMPRGSSSCGSVLRTTDKSLASILSGRQAGVMERTCCWEGLSGESLQHMTFMVVNSQPCLVHASFDVSLILCATCQRAESISCLLCTCLRLIFVFPLMLSSNHCCQTLTMIDLQLLQAYWFMTLSFEQFDSCKSLLYHHRHHQFVLSMASNLTGSWCPVGLCPPPIPREQEAQAGSFDMLEVQQRLDRDALLF